MNEIVVIAEFNSKLRCHRWIKSTPGFDRDEEKKYMKLLLVNKFTLKKVRIKSRNRTHNYALLLHII